MLRPIITFALLLFPLIEIAGFVVVGSRIGALATVGLVLASAILGAAVLRRAGVDAMRRMQHDLDSGGEPQGHVADSAMKVVAAILLMVPGFVSDIIGLLLLVPAVRRYLFRRLRDRITVVHGAWRGGASRRPPPKRAQTIDLDSDEYRQVEPRNSPWRSDSDDK